MAKITLINHGPARLEFELPKIGASGEQKRGRAVINPETGKQFAAGPPLNDLLALGPASNQHEGGLSPQQEISGDDWHRLLKGAGNVDILRKLRDTGVISVHGAVL